MEIKILSLTSFGNLWGNLNTKFDIIDIKFPFTCGLSDPYKNIVKFQNIMTRIVGLSFFRFGYANLCLHLLSTLPMMDWWIKSLFLAYIVVTLSLRKKVLNFKSIKVCTSNLQKSILFYYFWCTIRCKYICQKIMASDKIRQDQKIFIFSFAYGLIIIAKIWFLQRRLDTSLCPHLILSFCYYSLIISFPRS